jgi:nicotinate phosphoribosyltransferase
MEWLLKDTPALFTDLYELTMAQVYFKKKMNASASFEVTIRNLPSNWGFFVMAGLAELKAYLDAFCFSEEDIKFLNSLKLFSDEFMNFLKTFRPDVRIRALPEGTVFFPQEPVLEVTGPLLDAQIIESYVLNILGFSIVEASLATRFSLAAKGVPLIEFGLRRSQGPIAALRAVRGSQIGGFGATSNLLGARLFNLKPAGTMAHSFVEIHKTEEVSFENFIECYGSESILLIDTYDPVKGIKKAAAVAKQAFDESGTRIRGIRIDSGDFVKLSKIARSHFKKTGVDFLKIFVSGNMDEFRIAELLEEGVEADGFGVGTKFTVSHYAPDIDIIYKISEYEGRKMFKTSPQKETLGGRKTILRIKDDTYRRDIVRDFDPDASHDLLKDFADAEDIETIKARLQSELALFKSEIKRIHNPAKYQVDFRLSAK